MANHSKRQEPKCSTKLTKTKKTILVTKHPVRVVDNPASIRDLINDDKFQLTVIVDGSYMPSGMDQAIVDLMNKKPGTKIVVGG